MTDPPHGEFWADRVRRLKSQGFGDEVIRECEKWIPYPAAFREIVVAIRKEIRERRREKTDGLDLLEKLYEWAVIESFFDGIPWQRILSERILHSTAISCIKGIRSPYQEIGYRNLSLLNKTDVKWLVEALGEPSGHSTAKDANRDLWKQAVSAFRAAEAKDERHYWRAHGVDRSPRVSQAAAVFERAQKQGSGCLSVALAVLWTALILAGIVLG
jgi:hypothetical protein